MGVMNPRSGPSVVHTVHRIGAATVGAFLVVFALVGIVGGLPMMGTEGRLVMGLYANGLLAAISLLVGAVLVAGAVRGGPTASTVSIVVGALFLLSGLGNLLVIETPMNLLAFRLPNIVFSLAVGVVLLVLGAYGRLTGALRSDSPYHSDTPDGTPSLTVSERDERTLHRDAITELADAERAAAQRHATPEQRRRLDAVGSLGSADERRRAWEESAE